MLASGNGKVMQCVANLVRLSRGECVYDRIKGIDPSIIDQPFNIARPLMIADAKWLISEYEPRVSIEKLDIDVIVAETGEFAFNVNGTVEG